MRDEISSIVKDWYQKYDLASDFDRVYLFGSLVNDSGKYFWPSAIRGSDIDLLVRINPSHSISEQRVQGLLKLLACVAELEGEVATLLERPDGWQGKLLSILPVTWFEIYHCVHKGFDPKIFTLNIFWDVLDAREHEGGLSDYIDRTYQFDNTEVFSVMRLCQRLRNDALKLDVVGKSKVPDFQGHGVMPKEFMRAAALLKYADEGAIKPAARTNLQDGEEYAVELVAKWRDRDELIGQLFAVLRDRRSSVVPNPPAIESKLLLVLSELLFDRARDLSLPSAREAIDRMRRLSQGKPVYS